MTRQQFILHVTATQKAFRRFLVALCCGDKQSADDIAQEAYIKAYVASSTLKDESKFIPWLLKIGYNTFINHKRGSRQTASCDEVKEVAGEEWADNAFAYQDLYQALSKISVKERTALLLFYMQGYSIKEIAQIQETNEDAVKQHLSRGRKHLRGLLSKD